ncbi:hypothetical protein, partial [Rhizobium phaseoli]|uniref:hypothetical protein n=1 Tax=Rhizobium phaseoli TaxID=396 RepID=UPI0019541D7D
FVGSEKGKRDSRAIGQRRPIEQNERAMACEKADQTRKPDQREIMPPGDARQNGKHGKGPRFEGHAKQWALKEG